MAKAKRPSRKKKTSDNGGTTKRRGPVHERDLVSWIEHSNASVYRRDVLRTAHKARLMEYDQRAGTAQISPRGIEHVEEMLLPHAPP